MLDDVVLGNGLIEFPQHLKLFSEHDGSVEFDSLQYLKQLFVDLLSLLLYLVLVVVLVFLLR